MSEAMDFRPGMVLEYADARGHFHEEPSGPWKIPKPGLNVIARGRR